MGYFPGECHRHCCLPEMTQLRLPASVHRPDIDGLRALAIVPVCFYHAGLPAFSGGFVGVSVFFVISGYLMAKLIGSGLDRGEFSLLDFYQRRVRRIFPALIFALVVLLLIAAVLATPKLFEDFGATLAATSLFASNILLWHKTANYFDTPTEWNPLLHTWSLGVEEQFYILFPLFLMAVWRFGRRLRIGLMAAVALVSFALSVWGTANAPTAAFYLLPARAWELLLGSLVAFWAMRGEQSGPRGGHGYWIGTAGSLAGLLLIVWSLFAYDRDMEFPGASALVPTVGAALLIHFGHDGVNPVARLMGLAPLTFIGRISYSLYLWHWRD